MRSWQIARLPGAIAVFVALTFAAGFLVAEAAPATLSSNVTLSGQSAPQTQISPTLIHCDTCLPDLFISNADETTIGVAIDVSTAVQWTADATIDTSYDTDQIRQGTTAALTNDASAGSGTIQIIYSVHYIAGLFACGDEFPSCDGNNDFGKWETTGEVIEDTLSIETSGACSLDQTVCSFTDTIDVFSTGPIFLGAGVGVDLEVEHEFTIGPDGIMTHRIVGVAGATVPDADLTFSTPLPSTAPDLFFLPCEAAIDSSVDYNLTAIAASPSVSADLNVDVLLTLEIPGLPDPDLADIDLFDQNVFNGDVPLTGSPEPSLFLGSVLADNVAPVIDDIGGPYAGNEGSPITFSASASDNCGAPEYHWSFSDGGVAFGPEVQHTFADNGVYSGHLEVFDQQGNVDSADFVITVGDVAPNVSGGPDKTSDWGRTVSFQANGSDQGSIDNGSLLYTWDFDDPNSPVGAAGQNVTHVFSRPGTYDVEVTVTDKDGASSTDIVTVTVTKRETTITYTGALQSNPNKQVTLSASLTDEYGEAVPGSLVGFELGSQSGSANTNGSGNASTQVKLNQSPGSYTVSATFAGNDLYIASGPDSATFTIGNGGGGGGGGCGTPPCGGPNS